jgi:hypothetical protein
MDDDRLRLPVLTITRDWRRRLELKPNALARRLLEGQMKNIKLFPEIEEVFENCGEPCKSLFFPLVSFDLPRWGRLHVASVYGIGEPFDPIDDQMRYNFMRFKRTKESRYVFEGDLHYIQDLDKLTFWRQKALEKYEANKADYLSGKKANRAKFLHEWGEYQYCVISYWLNKEKYKKTGKLTNEVLGDLEPYVTDSRICLEDTLEELKRDGAPIKLNEADFTGIGVIGYNYRARGEEMIALFVIDDGKAVVQTFNWT